MLQFHVAMSFAAMLASAWCIYDLLRGQTTTTAVALFFVTNALTSLTGFPLPPFGFDAARAVGVICIIALIIGALAFYIRGPVGVWRSVFIATFYLASYFNFFVGVTQGFQKVPALQSLAPTQSEVPFVASQLILLIAFAAMAIATFLKFRNHNVVRPATRIGA
jgi:hypothetical protein